MLFTVDELRRLLDDLSGDGFGNSVVVFRPAGEPWTNKDGIVRASGLTPARIEGDGVAMMVDNSELDGPPGDGRTLCLIACNPFLRRIRYVPGYPGEAVEWL